LGEYVPQAGKGADGLAGMGGVFNYVNLHVYHYAGNNPLNYVDPDGRETRKEQIADGNTKQINTLHPDIRDKVTGLISDLNKKGISVGIVPPAVRTIEQQDAEYQKGRDENGNKIGKTTTDAKGGYSYHNYGLAIDLEVYIDLDKSWAKDWDIEGTNWQTVINEAEKAGFTAGYRWPGDQRDTPHFQMEFGYKTAEGLKALVEAGKVDKNGYVNLSGE
jgi:hypothetical protein